MTRAVRRAEPVDAPGIARVHVSAWRWAYRGLMPDALLASLDERTRAEWWSENVDRDDVWVCEEDGEVVGFASAGTARDPDVDESTVELKTLYILEAQLGSGVGSELLRVVEDRWREDERTTAVLWVASGNALGRDFYVRRGWEPDGTKKVEHVSDDSGIEALRYVKRLS